MRRIAPFLLTALLASLLLVPTSPAAASNKSIKSAFTGTAAKLSKLSGAYTKQADKCAKSGFHRCKTLAKVVGKIKRANARSIRQIKHRKASDANGRKGKRLLIKALRYRIQNTKLLLKYVHARDHGQLTKSRRIARKGQRALDRFKSAGTAGLKLL